MTNQFPHTLRPSLLIAALLSAGMLSGCEAKSKPDDAQLQALIAKAKDGMVFVKGGEFQMGDFGEVHGPDKLPYSFQQDDGPLHKVTVSDFSIAKYKVTLGDYDLYAKANKLPLPYMSGDASDVRVRKHPKSASFPVGVDWPDARAYCQWLGKQVGQTMDLPTEAEWEFAARARGSEVIFPTDNGKEEPGRNFATYDQTEAINGRGSGDMPVGLYPATALGLFDMGTNGAEWTGDWYAADYYARSPAANPRGPETGTKRAIRGLPTGQTHPTMTFQRRAREPLLADSPTNVTNRGYGFRCVARAAAKP